MTVILNQSFPLVLSKKAKTVFPSFSVAPLNFEEKSKKSG